MLKIPEVSFEDFLKQFKAKQALYETLIRIGLAKPIPKSNDGRKGFGRRSRRKVARK